MEAYTTIRKHSVFEYEDRKSVFIGEALPVSTEREALDFIASIKKSYPDAKHHVYAYVLRENSIMRFSDDKEPQGTAGLPVLDAIRKNNCTDTVIVVTRYFGGTLLGTGGLVKAYTAAAVGALNSAEFIRYDIYMSFKLTVSYSDYQKIIPVLTEFDLKSDDIRFTADVEVYGKIKKTEFNLFTKKTTEITAAKAKFDEICEKFDFS